MYYLYMKIVGTCLVPCSIHIAKTFDHTNNRNKIIITLLMQHKYTYIHLENLRSDSGRIAEYTRYHYDGKPLWCISAIKGQLYFDNDILFKMLNILNTRPLLPDVKMTIYMQLIQLPIDLRVDIIKRLEQSDSCINQLYQLFADEYHKQYDNLVAVFKLFSECHPYNADYKQISKQFQREIQDQTIVSKYMKRFKIQYIFKDEYIHFYDGRHRTYIVADTFRLYEGECRLNKIQWYKHVKVHMNMFSIIQSLINTEYIHTLDFVTKNILILSENWVSFLKCNGLTSQI